MRKNEKLVYTGQYFGIFSSTIAQYKDNTNNITYLFYATKEKNHIYIIRGSGVIQNVSIQIGQIEMNKLLPVQSGNDLFIDISDAIKSLTGVADMTITVVNVYPITLNFRIVPMFGYNYDNLARLLSLAQGNFCNLFNLVDYNYSRQTTLCNIAPPTKIIVPFENGIRKFADVRTINLPCYNSSYGLTNVKLLQGTTEIASTTYRYGSLLNFTINNLQGLYGVFLRILGYRVNDIILEDFNPAKKYVAVRWKNPYTNSVYFGLQGEGAPPHDQLNKNAVTFFELAEYEEEQQVESLESTGGEMPYIVKSEQRCKLRMTNLNAYDYIYYAQILKSESVEILFDTNLTESNYQPVKLEKSKITLPTNGTQLYNLEFNVIITEND